MLSAVLIFGFSLFIVFFIPNYHTKEQEENEVKAAKSPQMKKLWSLAQTAMKERKPLKAEKALLTILKFDEKNAAAYNRLGILYAKEKHFKEAIECFEIAQSLDNNASSLHNVGLIYYETGNYEKAAMAFEQAIEIEGDQPARYIAYAKSLEKLGKYNKAVDMLENAYSLNPSTIILRHLLELYENAKDEENIALTKKRIDDLQKLAKKETTTKTRRTSAARKATKAESAAKKQQNKEEKAKLKTAKVEAKREAKNKKLASKAEKKVSVQSKK